MTLSSPARRVVAVVRLAAAATLAVALIFQIVEKTVNNDMVPQWYFAYFTIQTTAIAIVVLIWASVIALRLETDPPVFTAVRMSVLTYAIVTAVVYNLLLRGIPDEGFVVSVWPIEIMHVWVPLVLVADWLFSPGRPALRWNALAAVIIFPIVWLAITLVRGAIDGWYPYPFLDPSSGWLSVIGYILGISVFVLALASGAIAYSRARAPKVAS